MQNRNVAVVTDALSADFFFPLWYRYYGAQFGYKNLHVATIKGSANKFAEFELGSVIEISQTYDDNDRLQAITDIVAKRLADHDFVIRVDCDEFLIADPNIYTNLREYIDQLQKPYVTSRGFEVYQHDEEGKLDINENILVKQRKYCIALTSLNKTAITSQPLRWSRGFHHFDNIPEFDHVFLFHLKRADIEWQLAWNRVVAPNVVTDKFIRSYYEAPEQKLRQFHKSWSQKRAVSGDNVMYRDTFNQAYLDRVSFNEQKKVYEAKNAMEDVNVIIPKKFEGIL